MLKRRIDNDSFITDLSFNYAKEVLRANAINSN